MLVVDLHALHSVNFLDFIDKIFLHRARAFDPKNIMRVNRTIRYSLSCPDDVVLLNKDVLAVRDQICLLVLFVVTFNDHFSLSTLLSAKPDNTVDLADNCRVGRRTCLK